MTKYVRRDLGGMVRKALDDMPVVVLTGMRQTGKSTFLRSEASLRSRRYLDLDDFAQLSAAQSDPEGFVAAPGPLTIDEVQKCPELLTAIKRAVDRDRRPGRFLLSGSANLSLLKSTSESLAGRAVYFTMRPFTRREIGGNLKPPPFLRHFLERATLPKSWDREPVSAAEVLTGGMPSVCLGEVQDRGLWFKGFEQTYLERDVRELSQLGNIIPFRNLLHLAALRTGQLLSPSQLGRDAQINAATATRYLSLLEASYVVYRISPYLRNRAGRLIKSPKLHLSDSGIACHLAGIKDFAGTAEGPLPGAMFETYVAQNLAGLIDAAWPEAELFFWNVQGRYEVDFVIEAGQRCLALEVKSGSRWHDRDLAGLQAFLAATPHCHAAIIATNHPDPVKLSPRLWALPLSLVLS